MLLATCGFPHLQNKDVDIRVWWRLNDFAGFTTMPGI
jgi:hypothetical protein